MHDRLRREKRQNSVRDRKKSHAARKTTTTTTTTVTTGNSTTKTKEAEQALAATDEGGDAAAVTASNNSQVGWLQWAFPSWGGWGSQTAQEEASAKTSTDQAATATSATTTTTSSTATPTPPTTSAEEAERIIEEEVWHMVTETSAESASLLKKDVVFAHVNFRLDSGTMQLVGDKQLDKSAGAASPTSPSCQPSASSSSSTATSSSSSSSVLLKLDFWNVAMVLESRPRTASSLFSLSLGSVRLQVKRGLFFDTCLLSRAMPSPISEAGMPPMPRRSAAS